MFIHYGIILDNTGWNAAATVFGPILRHILCHWHVHRLEIISYGILV